MTVFCKLSDYYHVNSVIFYEKACKLLEYYDMLIMFILQETFRRINNILIPFCIIFLLALAPGE